MIRDLRIKLTFTSCLDILTLHGYGGLNVKACSWDFAKASQGVFGKSILVYRRRSQS